MNSGGGRCADDCVNYGVEDATWIATGGQMIGLPIPFECQEKIERNTKGRLDAVEEPVTYIAIFEEIADIVRL